MTNTTLLKYTNLYTVNRYRNEFFDEWIKKNYVVKESHEPWSYGQETFTDRKTGERIFVEAHIMRIYVKGKNPYFKDFSHLYEWLDSNCKTQKEFFS